MRAECMPEFQTGRLSDFDAVTHNTNDVLPPYGFEAIVKDDFAALRRMLRRARSG
jgi:hypothetical protein